jgi:hypothetical protein
MDLNQAIRQGSQIVFERESVVRLDKLLGEIVRLAPGEISNDRLAKDLRDDRRFLIRRVDGNVMVTTRQIWGEEKTLLTSVVTGMGQRDPLQGIMSVLPP